jgi:hypothetical protein
MTADPFPTIIPRSVSYDFGMMNVSEEPTISGPIRFRHSTDTTGYTITLNYEALTSTDVNTLRDHYNNAYGSHLRFTAPTSIWGSPTIATDDSIYRYAGPPTEEQFGIYTNMSISLIVLIGLSLLYILDGNEAAQPAVAAFTSPAFTGNAPFILNAGGADPTLTLQGRGALQ